MIYLDNSATTRIDDEVVDAMLPWLREGYGNASSQYELGRRARVVIEQARTEIASLLGAHPAELMFTSGGTESNNAILKSMCQESKLVDQLAVGATEHHAVLHVADALASCGVDVYALPVDNAGRIVVGDVAARNTPRTLISVMHANNETGAMQPIEAVRSSAPDAYLHTDAVQSFGKVPVRVHDLGIDLATISAHKIHGPKGIGAMFIRKGIDFKAHQHGGAQERNRRAGTEPTALIVGFQHAARRAVAQMQARERHMRSCIDLARTLISAQIPDVRFNTPHEASLPNILNISFLDAERLDGEAILQQMDIAGVCVSNGSACVSGSMQPSHVLSAMGLPAAEARAAVRFSVSKDTTHEEVETAVAICADIIRKLRV
ncbi:MAG: cysteine desulfurase [Candidatus Kapabacteria bacterium]|nr:cysteine desulfurase [Candidatus Kapabacteria bacterium]